MPRLNRQEKCPTVILRRGDATFLKVYSYSDCSALPCPPSRWARAERFAPSLGGSPADSLPTADARPTRSGTPGSDACPGVFVRRPCVVCRPTGERGRTGSPRTVANERGRHGNRVQKNADCERTRPTARPDAVPAAVIGLPGRPKKWNESGSGSRARPSHYYLRFPRGHGARFARKTAWATRPYFLWRREGAGWGGRESKAQCDQVFFSLTPPLKFTEREI